MGFEQHSQLAAEPITANGDTHMSAKGIPHVGMG
jgi:hypothetical protein